jgi:hypothetical protein
MTSPPIPFHWLTTTLLFFVPERNRMTHLHQKLNQLTLTTMSRQLDQIASDAAARNLSFSQALESLADLELESRNQMRIPRHENNHSELKKIIVPR